MKVTYKKQKVAVAYGVVADSNDFQDTVEMFSPSQGWEYKNIFFEELEFQNPRPKYLATISRMIRSRQVDTLAIPSASRWLFANHSALFKLWLLAQQYKVRVIFVEKINFAKKGNQQLSQT